MKLWNLAVSFDERLCMLQNPIPCLLSLYLLNAMKIYTIFFKFYFIFKLYITVLVLPNIKMNPPQVYMCSPSSATDRLFGGVQVCKLPFHVKGFLVLILHLLLILYFGSFPF